MMHRILGAELKLDSDSIALSSLSSARALIVFENEKVEKDFNLGDGASLELYTIYKQGAEAALSFQLSKNAKLKIVDLFYGASSARVSVNMNAENCALDLLAKGTVEQGKRASYFANAKICPNARGAAVSLEEHAYLLGQDAKADLLPGLEISNSDVSARHASSISQLHPEQLFYLMSRGFSEQDAKKEIISGFLRKEKETIKSLFGFGVF